MTDKTLPQPYSKGTYHYIRGIQAHLLLPGYDNHPLISSVPVIKLAPPLDPRAFPNVRTAAQAMGLHSACLYWCPWHRTTIRGAYFSDVTLNGAFYTLIFQQQKRGLQERFRVLVFAQDVTLPKDKHFYQWLGTELSRLPPLDSG